MSKKQTRILSFLLSLIMIITVLPTEYLLSYAYEGSELAFVKGSDDELEYNNSDSNVTIQAKTYNKDYEIKTQFVEVDELVTDKDKVNLRTLPSIYHEDCEIVAPLYHGEIIKRTGINEELGWSRVEYNGQILYCISSYLELAEEIEEETVR